MPPPVIAAVAAGVVLVAIYSGTAARDLTVWDASEFMTAAHTLGIPHPPGTPLWVLIANVCTKLFSSLGPARAVTTLSVLAAAAAGGLGAALVSRVIGVRGGIAAAVAAGTMYSVWNNATETEVYALSLLASLCLLVAGEYAGRDAIREQQRRRSRALLAFIVGLAVPLHLSVLVALPAAVLFAWHGAVPRARDVLRWIALMLLGVSAVAVLPLLAAQSPSLNSGNPVSLEALIAVLRRSQYAVAGLWPRALPLWLQLGNLFQWADWQVAYGVHPFPTPSLFRTLLTLSWTALGAVGLRALWRRDPRVARALAMLLGSGTIGVAIWLNLRAGPTFGGVFLPAGAIHEARERDYFFMLGFFAWGLLAGSGLWALGQYLLQRISRSKRQKGRGWALSLATMPIVLAMLPYVANRQVMDRTREPAASMTRTYARLLLEAVPEGGVLIAAGDNDSFPLWYLQQVEDIRSDVAVVTIPLLGAAWYRNELGRRGLLPPEHTARWRGAPAVLRALMERAGANRRAVRVSTLLARVDREQLDPGAGWVLEGLVYAPSAALAARTVGLDIGAMQRTADMMPSGVLAPLPAGSDDALAQLQRLLRCAQRSGLTDSLLVSRCRGL